MGCFFPSVEISATKTVKGFSKEESHGFCTRKMGKETYLYQKPHCEGFKSAILLFVNPFKNIFYDCIGLLILSLLSSMGVNLGEKLQLQTELKMKSFTYFKSLGVLIPQIFINLTGALSFGLLSHRCNLASGDLERWASGTTKEDLLTKSRNYRIYEREYIAPCEQPLAILKEGYKDTSGSVSFSDVTRADDSRRWVYSILATRDNFAPHINSKTWNSGFKDQVS